MSFFVKEKTTGSLISPHNGSEGVQNPKRKRSKLQADDDGNKDKGLLITTFREQRLLLLDRRVLMKVGGILAWNQNMSNFSEIKSYLFSVSCLLVIYLELVFKRHANLSPGQAR